MSPARRISRRAFSGLLLGATSASALSRIPQGGTLRLAVPWGLARIDPHALDDPIAALFASAICDPLYALDGSARAYPALASALPETTGSGSVRVRLRPGLSSATGKPLSAADVSFSLDRAARQSASAWLAGIGRPRVDPRDPLSLLFPRANPSELAAVLANPLLSVVPRGYSPLEPDGTGAFSAAFEAGRLVLRRNPNGARGPGFLERIEVRTASDLADALREFESGNVDVGWLGSGLHRPRSDALPFRGIAYGFAVLRAGKLAGAWSAPGVMQQLLDAIEPSRLRHLGLEGLPNVATGSARWQAAPAELRVSDEAPQLISIARTLAATLGNPGHEISVVPTPRVELERRRAGGDFALFVDFVRSFGDAGPMTQKALLSAQDPELAKKPPRLETFAARGIGRMLSFGVIGELWASGAHAPRFQALTSFQLGGVYRLADAS